MLERAAHLIPDLENQVRAFPRDFHFGDLFTGVGTFEKVTEVLVYALRKRFPRAMKGLIATCPGKVLWDVWYCWCRFICF